MTLQFPSSPIVGELYPDPPVLGIGQFRWDGTKWTGAVMAPVATAQNVWALTPGCWLTTDSVAEAMPFVNMGGMNGNTTPDFTQFINAFYTATAAAQLQFPSVDVTPLIGRSGLLRVVFQASVALTFASGYTFNDMTVPTFDNTAGNWALFSYTIISATQINIALIGSGMHP
jgi:hypothetical protein